MAESKPNLVARVKFTAQVIHRVRERQHYAFECEEIVPDTEAVIATYRLRRTDELLPWLLDWGAAVEVLEPEQLRTEIRKEAQKMLYMLT